MLAFFVDEIAFASNSSRIMTKFKSALSATLSVKLFGQLRSFVGWTISINEKSIKIDEGIHAKSLLEEHGMAEADAVHTPLPQNADVTPKREDEEPVKPEDHTKYRSIVGGLLYLSVGTRPAVSFPISVLACHCHKPTKRDLIHLKRVPAIHRRDGDVMYQLPSIRRDSESALNSCQC